MMTYYPITTSACWTYKMKDGSEYTNKVQSVQGNLITMVNSTQPEPSLMKVENGIMYNQLMTPGNFQPWLKDTMNMGDTWDATFTANGLNSVLVCSVKETGLTKVVEGVTYSDVVMIEAESKISMNGNLISTQFFTQHYYAKNVGLILTTSSMGDSHALIKYDK